MLGIMESCLHSSLNCQHLRRCFDKLITRVKNELENRDETCTYKIVPFDTFKVVIFYFRSFSCFFFIKVDVVADACLSASIYSREINDCDHNIISSAFR